MSNSLDELRQSILSFRDEREWKQFHNPKDLAIGLSIEASELLETFLWKSPDEAALERIKEEMADIMIFLILLEDRLQISLLDAAREKLEINGRKYPVEKARGSSVKYTEL